MKKPTEKRIKECLKDIESNFTELINAIIWYEQKNMDDWAYDIIGYIENLPRKERVLYLFDDLSNRISDDLSNPKYQGLWYALFNVEQTVENTHEEIISRLKTHTNKELALNFIKSLDEGEDSDGEINVRTVLKQFADTKLKP
jgi:hypothetical protein